jgi:hypothetical protein
MRLEDPSQPRDSKASNESDAAPHYNDKALPKIGVSLEKQLKAAKQNAITSLLDIGLTIYETSAVLDYGPSNVCKILSEPATKITLSFTDRFLTGRFGTTFTMGELKDALSKEESKERNISASTRDILEDRATGLIKIWLHYSWISRTKSMNLFKVVVQHLDARINTSGSPGPEMRMQQLMVSAERVELWTVDLSERDFKFFLRPIKVHSKTPFEKAVGNEEKALEKGLKKGVRQPIAKPLNKQLDANVGIVGGIWEATPANSNTDLRKESMACAISAMMERKLNGWLTSIYCPMDEVGISNLRNQWDAILEAYKALTFAPPARRGRAPDPENPKNKPLPELRRYCFAFAFCLPEPPRPMTLQ